MENIYAISRDTYNTYRCVFSVSSADFEKSEATSLSIAQSWLPVQDKTHFHTGHMPALCVLASATQSTQAQKNHLLHRTLEA